MNGVPAAAAFGPYLIEELISQSAAASVFRATDSRHGGRAVALKLFAPHLSADPAFRERFRRDAGLLSALREPHVVPVHTYGVHNGVVYLDMRLIQGRSLAAARAKGIDAAWTRAVVDQLDAAVGAIRAGGLGDRDVTAEDVLLSGPPGREFVHVVGLGLGRAPATAPPDLAMVVGASPQSAVRKRRWWPVATIAATLALVTALIVWASASGPAAPLAPGQVAAMSGGGAAGAAATTTLDGTPVVVAASGGAIRTWNLETGRSAAPEIDVDARAVATVVVDGGPAVVSRGPDQLIRVHRLADGREIGGPIGTAEPIPPDWRVDVFVRELVTAEVDGRPVVVGAEATESDRNPNLGFAVWALPTGEPIVDLMSPGPTITLDLDNAMIDGIAVVVALSTPLQEPGSIQAYEAATGNPVGRPIVPGVPVSVIDVVDRGSGPLVVAGGDDNSVRLFDLRTSAPIGPVLRGHLGPVTWVSVVRSGERDLIVSSGGGETRFWDLDGGTPVGRPVPLGSLHGVPLATAEVNGRGVLVTSAADGAAVWDVAELVGEGAP